MHDETGRSQGRAEWSPQSPPGSPAPAFLNEWGVTSFQKDLISPDWMSVLQRAFQCCGLEASEVLCQLLPVFWPAWPGDYSP